MTTSIAAAVWNYEYLREIPRFRIFPEDDEPENYVAETNEHLPADVQERYARLITAGPRLLDALLDIKRPAGKSGDHEADPFALLDLIACEARKAINIATKE